MTFCIVSGTGSFRSIPKTRLVCLKSDQVSGSDTFMWFVAEMCVVLTVKV